MCWAEIIIGCFSHSKDRTYNDVNPRSLFCIHWVYITSLLFPIPSVWHCPIVLYLSDVVQYFYCCLFLYIQLAIVRLWFLPLLLFCQFIPFSQCRFNAIGFRHIYYNSKYIILSIVLNKISTNYSNIYISNVMQRYIVYSIWKLLYIFRVVPLPIIRSANNCINSIWYLSHRYCYLPQTAGSSNGVTNTRCCRYSCLRSCW